jgi:cyclophilin family peptidyl-prolyl cis-trans isomerase/HEAT repeat protein
MKIVYWLYILLLLSGCAFNEPNKFSDSSLITIYSLQDRRKTDSLILFLLDKNPVYRAEAALALASVQDSIASLQLGTTLLEDPYLQARINAAFALGQTGGYAAMNALIPALTDSSSAVVNEVLQGLGKVVAARDINAILNFNPKDSIQQSGLVWGFYFAGMRGITNEFMAERARRFLAPEYSASTRLGAAHFFNRALDLKTFPAEELIRAAGTDKDAQVRMAATAALRKLDFTISLPVLKKILSEEPDYRVRVNAARIIAAKATPDEDALIILALNDKNEQVAIATAEALKDDFAKTGEALDVARSAKNFRLQTTIYRKLLIQNPAMSDEIKKQYQQSTNVYHRAGLLSALSEDENSQTFLFNHLIQSPEPVIKTTAATALTTINRTKRNNTALNRAEFARMYKEALLNGDAGVIGIVASILADTSFNYKSVIEDFSFLYAVKKKLTLPRDYEAIQPLEEAIAYFEGKGKPAAPKNEYNHPIDWRLVKTIHKNQKVNVTTTQGDFSLELFVENAPGTVANFVSLLNQKYFDEKYVHRMVPNFVIQTGCNRGDGYGSEPYSIRSEFSLHRYNEGSVGMASAGKDTEGTQWFVTHSPTPHLDGRYTLFANVTRGMEVVHKIDVGDKILSVRLQDN